MPPLSSQSSLVTKVSKSADNVEAYSHVKMEPGSPLPSTASFAQSSEVLSSIVQPALREPKKSVQLSRPQLITNYYNQHKAVINEAYVSFRSVPSLMFHEV